MPECLVWVPIQGFPGLQLLAQLWFGESCPVTPGDPQPDVELRSTGSAGLGSALWRCFAPETCGRERPEPLWAHRAAGPGINVPEPCKSLGTQCWGNSKQGDPTGDRRNHPSCSQTPGLLFLCQGRLQPEESAHLGALIHGLCSHCLGPGTQCQGEEDETHESSGAPGAAPLTGSHGSEGETELPSAPLERISPRAGGTGSLWDQCVESAGSWCGMRQDQLRSCPAQPGMPQLPTPRDEPPLAVPAGRSSFALALGCAQLWSTVAVPGWEYLAV